MTISVLLVDDDIATLEIAQKFLQREDSDLETTLISSAKFALVALKESSFDIIVSDYQMPGMDGLELLQQVREFDSEIPFIMWTGRGREEVAISALNLGATHYIKKEGPPSVHYAELAHIITNSVEHQRAKLALEESTERYRGLVEDSIQGFAILQDGRYVYVNPAFARTLNKTVEEVLILHPDEMWAQVHPDDKAELQERNNLLEQGVPLVPRHRFRYLREDGSIRWVDGFIKSIEYNGKPAVQIVEIDISEQVEAEIALRKSELKHRTLVEASRHGVIITIPPWMKVVYANPELARILGYSIDEILAMTSEDFPKLIHPDDLQWVQNLMTQRSDSDLSDYTYEARAIRKSGEIAWFEVRSSLVEYEGERAFHMTFTDMTDRKQSELVRERELNAFKMIAEAAVQEIEIPDLCHHVLASLIEGLDFDSGSLRLYDLERDVLKPTALYGYKVADTELIKPAKIDDESLIVSHVARTGQALFVPNIEEFELIDKFKDRLERFKSRSFISYPIIGLDSELIGVLTVNSETPGRISERDRLFFETIVNMLASAIEKIRAEQALSESEHKQRVFLERLLEGIVVLNDDGIVYINPRALEIIGVPVEERGRYSIEEGFSFIHPDDMQLALSLFSELKKKEEFGKQAELRFIARDGVIKYVETFTQQVEYEGASAIQIILLDITNRKLAERARENEQTAFRIIAEAAMRPTSIAEFCGQSLKGLMDILQYDIGTFGLYEIDQKLVRPIAAFGIDDEIRESYIRDRSIDDEISMVSTVARTGEGLFIEDMSNHPVFGQKRIVQDLGIQTAITWAVPSSTGNEKLGIIQLMHRDRKSLAEGDIRFFATFARMIGNILERRKAEQLLVESEIRNRTVLDISPDAFFVTDLLGRFTMVNQRALEMYGSDDEQDVLGRFLIEVIEHDEFDDAIEALASTRETGIQRGLNFNLRRTDGSAIPVEVNSSLLKDSEGNPVEIIATARDISYRLASQKALKDSERRYKTLIESSAQGIIITFGIPPKIVFANKTMQSITGYNYEEIVNFSGEEIMDFIHLEDREEVLSSLTRTLESANIRPFIEVRVRRKDGMYIWVELAGRTIEWEGQKALQATIVDVTSRRRAEDESTRHQRELELYATLLQHDIGNDLQLMMQYADMAEAHLQKQNPDAGRMLESLRAVAERTGLLLRTFAFRQDLVDHRMVTLLTQIVDRARIAHPNLRVSMEVDEDVKTAEVAAGRLL
ncbi:MAG: PAS domain S-box protein, partial [Candidatus Thorarchaeota archaeon]